jgi:hypothetical protein
MIVDDLLQQNLTLREENKNEPKKYMDNEIELHS